MKRWTMALDFTAFRGGAAMSLMGYCVADASSQIHERLLCGLRTKHTDSALARRTAYLAVDPGPFE